MNIDTIRKITLQFEAKGEQETTAAAKRTAASLAGIEAACWKLTRQQELQLGMQKQCEVAMRGASAATDAYAAQVTSLGQAHKAANDNAAQSNRSLLDTGAAALATAGHLKGLALVAYAMSPALRAMVNPAIAQGLAAIGPAAVSAGATAARALTPLLGFVTRIGGPVLAIAAAWQVLNAVIERGAGLLDKYGNSQRDLVAGVDDSLKKLTKFQDDNLTAEQVRQATELGARLTEANRKIADFAKVQFDLTEPALKLQGAWVLVVEAIAKGVEQINKLIALVPQIPQIPGLDTMIKLGSMLPGPAGAPFGVARGLTAATPETTPSQAEALAAAYQRLGAAMGSTSNFAVRFGQAINDLANPPKQAAEAAKAAGDAWTRYADQVTKATAAQTANAKTVGLGAQAHEQLKVQLQGESILERDGVADTEARRAALKKLAEAAGEAAQALEKAKIANDIKFQAGTMFLSDQDVQIASKLRGLYGDDIPKALGSSEAATMRLQMMQKTMFDQAKAGTEAFLGSLASGLMQNKSLTESLHQAFTSLTSMATNAAVKNLLEGNLPLAAVDAAVAIGSKLAGGLFDDSKQKELEKAQQAFAGMALEMHDFTMASEAPAAKRPTANDNARKETKDDRDQHRRAA